MESSDQFETVMRLPHRRHAFGVNAPALFRHIGLRIETQDENPLTATDPTTSTERRDDLIVKLNDALKRLQEHRARGDDIYSFCNSVQTSDKNRLLISETLLIELKTPPPPAQFEGWRLRFRLDMYDEYYFITLILDQRGRESHQRAREICELEDQLSSGHEPATPAQSQQFLNAHYDTIWTQIDGFLARALEQFPGRRFTEFRGIALRELTNPLRRDTGDTHKISKLSQEASNQSRDLLRAWVARNETFVSEVLQLKQWSGVTDQDANCVLSELLGGGAIYFSSVRQAHVPSATDDPPPLRYFILYNGLSRYQLGRLIRRTHVLGELRCAAVLDFDLLEEASAGLRSLGNHIDNLLVREGASLTDRQLKMIQHLLNRLASSRIPGGLLYRVNRSRLYVNTFQQRIEEMRVSALEGWQSYSEFFRRNLYPQFEQVDQIGKRYEMLAERVNRLTHARNAEKLNDFQNAMIRIQRLGEIIGLAAFTYYGGHILASVLMVIWKWPCGHNKTCLDLVEHSRDTLDVTGMVVAACLAVGLYRLWSHRRLRQGAG